MVRSLITFNLLGAGIDARDEPQNAQGVPDTIINLPEAQLSLVFKYKFESSADVHKLDQRLTEACLQIQEKYGLTARTQGRIARFAFVYCAAKRKIMRAQLVDLICR